MHILQPDRILLKRQIRSALGYFTGGMVLDLGCGRINRYLDNNSRLRRISLDIAPTHQPDIIGDAHALPFADGSIPNVLCTQMLEHCAHPNRVLTEIARILEPGGIAILTAPQWNELHEMPYDFFRYTSFGLKKLAEDAGLAVVTMDRRGGVWSCAQQLAVRYLIDRLGLYRPERRWLNILVGTPLNILTHLAVGLDGCDRSEASARHAIGWLTVLRRQRTTGEGCR